jgi:hypothetical protein
MDNNVSDQFNKLQETVMDNNTIRKELIDKLIPVVKEMQLTPGADKSTITDAKLNIIKTLDDILKSGESSIAGNIKLILQQKNNEEQSKTNEQVAELLKRMSNNVIPRFNNNGNTVAPADADKVFEETLKKENITISEAELELHQPVPKKEEE